MTFPMKRLLLLLLIVGCHAHKEPTPIPVVALHPAGETKSDCHPEKEMAATFTEEASSAQPWWMTHHPQCPADKRLVWPSDREASAGYKPESSWEWDSDEWMNWRTKHTTCIPDGLGK